MKQPDDSPSSSSIEPIDIEELDSMDVSSSGPVHVKASTGLGSAFRQVKPHARRLTSDSEGSPASTSSDSKKEKHVWRPY